MQKTEEPISFHWLSSMSLRTAILFSSLMLVMNGCVTSPPPVEDYALARSALDYAKAVDAARYSSGYFHKAEESYRKAQAFFEDREYLAAKKEFKKAKEAAEKAENSARLIRFKNGEVL